MSNEREQLIHKIEDLYPADSDYSDTAKTGRILLQRAIIETWRELPLDALRAYAELCRDVNNGMEIPE